MSQLLAAIARLRNAFVKDERGISSIEYAMIAVLVLGSLAAVMVSTKTDIASIFSGMSTSVHTAATASSGSSSSSSTSSSTTP